MALIAKKRFGQNFLIDPNIRKKIVDCLDLSENTVIFEIGPGKGFLTEKLKAFGKKIYIVEIDYELINLLKSEFEDNRIVIFNEDILNFDFNKHLDSNPENNVIIGNLPYNISSQILFKLTTIYNKIYSIVVMLQKDFALRLIAEPNTKKYNAFTVILNYYFEIEKMFNVSHNCFEPKPKIESSVVRLIPKKIKEQVNAEKFNRFLRAAFNNKRKTLVNSLKNNSDYNTQKVIDILEKMGLSKTVRAEKITLSQFIEIFKFLN